MTSLAFIEQIFPYGSVPAGLATLSIAVAIGIALGNVRVKGVRLGIAAVLFVALLFAEFGLSIQPEVLEYFRDFALVLFVYTLGLQMGPGFFASIRAEGLRLNFLAVTVVLLGAVTTALIVYFAKLPREIAAGLFTGGFATTPALAAGQEALHGFFNAHPGANSSATLAATTHAMAATNLAYSVAYPFGLTGPILLVILFRVIFRVKIKDEVQALADAEQISRPPQSVVDIEVTSPQMTGVALRDQRCHQSRGVLFTRLLRGQTQSVPTASTVIQMGDIFRAVGPQSALDELVKLLGKVSAINLAEVNTHVDRADLLVTQGKVLGKHLRELDLINRHGVTIARIQRSGVDLPARAGTTLHFGDTVTVVGPDAGIKAMETELGNSTDAVNQTQLIPIFLGIWLGVIVGSVPILIPGLHTPVRIGLAGGPMLVAIALSRLGNIGSVVWYMPPAANQILRDFGMAVFLACVGFQSGDHFFEKLIYGGGLPLVGWGAVITIVPMLLVGLFARIVFKMNFVTLTGLISGAMTSSPTLLFSNETTASTAPAVAYAAVYPLAMLVPVFCAQLLVTLLMR
jgi:putative transport protein